MGRCGAGGANGCARKRGRPAARSWGGRGGCLGRAAARVPLCPAEAVRLRASRLRPPPAAPRNFRDAGLPGAAACAGSRREERGPRPAAGERVSAGRDRRAPKAGRGGRSRGGAGRGSCGSQRCGKLRAGGGRSAGRPRRRGRRYLARPRTERHGTERNGPARRRVVPAVQLRAALKVAVLLRVAAGLPLYVSSESNAPMADASPGFIRDRDESASIVWRVSTK